VARSLENDMDFLGVSGVEDKLQTNVQTTIESLKDAGIQVWMLTGDRVETGVSIAISSGLKSKKHDLYFITGGGEKNEITRKLIEYKTKAPTTILIIDGTTLDLIFEE
jgi:phospholipid-translocating ATPase